MTAATTPRGMTAIEISEPGDPGVLVPVERGVPEPGPGEVLVAVEAAGVNRPDVMQRQGLYPPPPGASDIPGLEIAGTVAALGDGVDSPAIGSRVCALVTGGGYAEYCTAPRAALPARSRRTRRGRRRGAPGDVLHGLDQRLRPRPPRRGGVDPGPRRVERHRHHRDTAREGVRRDRLRHRGVEGEVRRLPRARSRRGRQLSRRGLRRAHPRAHRRARRRRGARHDRRRLPRAEPEVPRRRRPTGDYRGAARPEGRTAQRAAHHAPAPDGDRVHAPPPFESSRRRPSRTRSGKWCGRCSRPARSGRSCTRDSRSPTLPAPTG